MQESATTATPQDPVLKLRRYTISAIICTPPNKEPRWSGQVEVDAESSADAKEKGLTEVCATIPHTADEDIQILRVQPHSGIFHTGEVAGLDEFGADFSPDRLYRYRLYRVWDKSKLPLMFIGLNPSTADERIDDPTVRRCLRFAKDLGYGGLIMANAFALRATSPTALKAVNDPVGPENDAWLIKLAQGAGLVIAAWGNHGSINGRGQQIRQLLPKLHCFVLTKTGQPKHPLYLRADLKPSAWTCPVQEPIPVAAGS
jgi:hypothetical protein